VDPTLYSPEPAGAEPLWSMGYLGTYSDDRQPTLDALLLDTARRLPDEKFIVAGPDYPDTDRWPANVEHTSHLPPSEHRAFYNQQRWTLNVTRRDMIRAGYAPSVRLFEAAACGTPIVSDAWEGLDTFFTPGKEIVIARYTDDVLHALCDISPGERRAIGDRARARVLAAHTAAHRARELEEYARELIGSLSSTRGTPDAVRWSNAFRPDR
jgi:spore maturation protein CgeB